jgi:hypothetical protein
MNRKKFLQQSIVGAAGLIGLPKAVFAFQQDKPAPFKPEIVKEFVGKSHSNMDRIKEMLENEPGLLHVAWDWGGGDFETGLGAASHVGYRDLSVYLLEKGARMNLFTAAMLGDLKLVKMILDSYPGQLHTKGPHGLSLMHHAQKGKDDALAVVEYLESLE